MLDRIDAEWLATDHYRDRLIRCRTHVLQFATVHEYAADWASQQTADMSPDDALVVQAWWDWAHEPPTDPFTPPPPGPLHESGE